MQYNLLDSARYTEHQKNLWQTLSVSARPARLSKRFDDLIRRTEDYMEIHRAAVNVLSDETIDHELRAEFRSRFTTAISSDSQILTAALRVFNTDGITPLHIPEQIIADQQGTIDLRIEYFRMHPERLVILDAHGNTPIHAMFHHCSLATFQCLNNLFYKSPEEANPHFVEALNIPNAEGKLPVQLLIEHPRRHEDRMDLWTSSILHQLLQVNPSWVEHVFNEGPNGEPSLWTAWYSEGRKRRINSIIEYALEHCPDVFMRRYQGGSTPLTAFVDSHLPDDVRPGTFHAEQLARFKEIVSRLVPGITFQQGDSRAASVTAFIQSWTPHAPATGGTERGDESIQRLQLLLSLGRVLRENQIKTPLDLAQFLLTVDLATSAQTTETWSWLINLRLGEDAISLMGHIAKRSDIQTLTQLLKTYHANPVVAPHTNIIQLALSNPKMLAIVAQLIDQYPHLAQEGATDGATILHIAAEEQQWDLCSTILKKFPDLATRIAHKGYTPLHAICYHLMAPGLATETRQLLDTFHEQAPHLFYYRDHQGNTPIDMLFENDKELYYKLLQYVCQKHVDKDSDTPQITIPIQWSTAPQAARSIPEHGTSMLQADTILRYIALTQHSIHNVAAQYRFLGYEGYIQHLAMIADVLQDVSVLRCLTGWGNSPIFMLDAISKHDIAGIRLLVRCGSPVEFSNPRIPLIFNVLKEGKVELVRAFLQIAPEQLHTTITRGPEETQITPLYMACHLGHADIAKLFVDEGVSPAHDDSLKAVPASSRSEFLRAFPGLIAFELLEADAHERAVQDESLSLLAHPWLLGDHEALRAVASSIDTERLEREMRQLARHYSPAALLHCVGHIADLQESHIAAALPFTDLPPLPAGAPATSLQDMFDAINWTDKTAKDYVGDEYIEEKEQLTVAWNRLTADIKARTKLTGNPKDYEARIEWYQRIEHYLKHIEHLLNRRPVEERFGYLLQLANAGDHCGGRYLTEIQDIWESLAEVPKTLEAQIHRVLHRLRQGLIRKVALEADTEPDDPEGDRLHAHRVQLIAHAIGIEAHEDSIQQSVFRIEKDEIAWLVQDFFNIYSPNTVIDALYQAIEGPSPDISKELVLDWLKGNIPETFYSERYQRVRAQLTERFGALVTEESSQELRTAIEAWKHQRSSKRVDATIDKISALMRKKDTNIRAQLMLSLTGSAPALIEQVRSIHREESEKKTAADKILARIIETLRASIPATELTPEQLTDYHQQVESMVDFCSKKKLEYSPIHHLNPLIALQQERASAYLRERIYNIEDERDIDHNTKILPSAVLYMLISLGIIEPPVQSDPSLTPDAQ